MFITLFEMEVVKEWRRAVTQARGHELEERSMLKSLERQRNGVLALVAQRSGLLAWSRFVRTGELSRTESLDRPMAMDFLRETQGYPEELPLHLQPYSSFLSLLFKYQDFIPRMIAVRVNDPELDQHYKLKLVDLLAYRITLTAHDVNTAKLQSSIVEQLCAIELPTFATNDIDVVFGRDSRAFCVRVAVEMIKSHFCTCDFLSGLSRLTEHVFLDEECVFSAADETSASPTFSFYEDVFELISQAVQNSVCIQMILKVLLCQCKLFLNVDYPEILIHHVVFNHVLLDLIEEPIASPLKMHLFLTSFALNNLQQITRHVSAMSSLKETEQVRSRFMQFCATIASQVSNFELNQDSEGLIVKNTVCFDQDDLNLLLEVFSRTWDYVKEWNKDFKQIDRFAKKAQLPKNEKVSFIIPLSDCEFPEKISSESTILTFLNSGRLNTDDSVNELIPKPLQSFLTAFAEIPMGLITRYSTKSHDLKESLKEIIGFLTNGSDGSMQPKNDISPTSLCSHLLFALSYLEQNDNSTILQNLSRWIKIQIDSHNKIWAARSSAIAAERYKLEHSILVYSRANRFFEQRLSQLKAYGHVSSLEVRMKHNIEIPEKKISYAISSNSFNDFVKKLKGFVFSDILNTIETYQPGMSLVIVSQSFSLFIESTVKALNQDIEAQQVFYSEEESLQAVDIMSNYMVRNLHSAFHCAVISVLGSPSRAAARSVARQFQESVTASSPNELLMMEYFHDEKFSAQVKVLTWMTAKHLDLKLLPGFPIEILWEIPTQILKDLGSWKCRTVSSKVSSLKRCYKTLIDGLGVAQGTRHPDADSAFPALVLLLLKAKPRNLCSNLEFIRQFSTLKKLASDDLFCVLQFSLAITFIMNSSTSEELLP